MKGILPFKMHKKKIQKTLFFFFFFRVTGLKILGKVGSFFFLILILCILKGICPFKMHKIIFFQEILKKILDFTSKFM